MMRTPSRKSVAAFSLPETEHVVVEGIGRGGQLGTPPSVDPTTYKLANSKVALVLPEFGTLNAMRVPLRSQLSE